MPNAGAIITNALIALGELAPGQVPNDSESFQLQITLNNIIGNWNIQDLMATSATTQTIALSSGVQSYTSPTRVSRVVSASVVMAAGPTLPLQILNAQEWNQLTDKDASSNKVQALFYNAGFTNGIIYLAPRPLANLTLTYLGWIGQATFADLTTSQTLLPGYERALTAALALEAQPMYPDRSISPALANAYKESMSEIRRLNAGLWGIGAAPVASQAPVSPQEVAAG